MRQQCISLMSYALPQVKEFTAKEIKLIRLKEQVSQAVFAKYLNTSASTIK
ncbi:MULTISPECIES: helix-turn-helix domain-containing protein [Legionella]|uniref:Helix-turn-helix protein n=1 Tax=Legionella maceachernii TaxID=466 RepID=A0A0W0VUV1_9GAMM|nr:hypothetical protein [Legionella maceachernii]KTD24016.1 hypothetical protein Lmac_2889 [Legionella maceachernii]SKA19576.1 putative transcriptional regulator [Legionella maceachernii]SUP04328.1 Uncharacterised protein [Legionella maceachernii]